jgi:ribose transport system substrate-binding protein
MACAIAAVVLLQLLVVAPAGADEAQSKPITVGLSMHFMRDDYAIRLVDAVESTMGEYRASNTLVTDANADAAKQLADIENLVVRGVSAIIVVPIDEKAILPAIRKANERNIPVVAITRIPGAQVLATIGATGDYANGMASGGLLVEATGGTGKVAVINIPYSLWRIDERERGFLEALEDSELEIVARQSALDQAKVFHWPLLIAINFLLPQTLRKASHCAERPISRAVKIDA